MFDWSFLKNQKFWLAFFAIIGAFATLLWPEKQDFIKLVVPLFISLAIAIFGIDAVEAWVMRAYAKAELEDENTPPLTDDKIEAKVRELLRRYDLIRPSVPPDHALK